MSNITIGQKVIVRSQLTNTFLNGHILSFFRLNDQDVTYMRKKSKIWRNVQSGDRAFYFKATQDPCEKEPRVFVIGYSDLYICAR